MTTDADHQSDSQVIDNRSAIGRVTRFYDFNSAIDAAPPQVVSAHAIPDPTPSDSEPALVDVGKWANDRNVVAAGAASASACRCRLLAADGSGSTPPRGGLKAGRRPVTSTAANGAAHEGCSTLPAPFTGRRVSAGSHTAMLDERGVDAGAGVEDGAEERMDVAGGVVVDGAPAREQLWCDRLGGKR
jgi:hypothetical protein